MKVEFDIKGLDNILEMLNKLPPELVSNKGGVVAKSARAGISVISNESKKQLKRVVSTPGKTGENYSTGLSATKIRYKRDTRVKNGERYYMTVKGVPYPDRKADKKGKFFRTNDAAYMLEYGTSKQAAEPWLRPAFESKKEEAINKATSSLVAGVDKIASRLLKT